jgi:hypothetical protein
MRCQFGTNLYSLEMEIENNSNVSLPFCSSTFTMTVHARQSIPSGGLIYHSYSHLLLPTNLRRLMLYTGKHFSCECPRCLDPTELGSFAGAHLCKKCNVGPVVPVSPIDMKSEWKCFGCQMVCPDEPQEVRDLISFSRSPFLSLSISIPLSLSLSFPFSFSLSFFLSLPLSPSPPSFISPSISLPSSILSCDMRMCDRSRLFSFRGP